eukprot:scaffold50540_cov18-Tisochrysis_lutea.AAC.1
MACLQLKEQQAVLAQRVAEAEEKLKSSAAVQASQAKKSKELEDAQAAIAREHDRLEALQEDMEKRRAELAVQVTLAGCWDGDGVGKSCWDHNASFVGSFLFFCGIVMPPSGESSCLLLMKHHASFVGSPCLLRWSNHVSLMDSAHLLYRNIMPPWTEKEVVAREKKVGKEMASAAKQVHENVKRTKDLNQQESEVRDKQASLAQQMAEVEAKVKAHAAAQVSSPGLVVHLTRWHPASLIGEQYAVPGNRMSLRTGRQLPAYHVLNFVLAK